MKCRDLSLVCVLSVVVAACGGGGGGSSGSAANDDGSGIADDQNIVITQTDNDDAFTSEPIDLDGSGDVEDTDVFSSESDGDATASALALPNSFADSRIELGLPADWIENTQQFPGVVAQFLAPDINPRGGRDNCTLSYEFTPGSSLLDQLDQNLDVIFLPDPEPEVSFTEVNNVPAARISGTTQIGTLMTELFSQVIFRDDWSYFLVCFGTDRQEEFTAIMDSVVIP